MLLTGKNALITGAARGIGAATVERLRRRGCERVGVGPHTKPRL